MQFQALLAFAAVLMAVPGLAQQRPICDIKPGPAQCRIDPKLPCPGGCIKRNLCLNPGTVTATSTNTETETVTEPASTVTTTLTTTASANATPASACATQVPFMNLYSFPDATCGNSTTTGANGRKTECRGLNAPPNKLNTLTYDANLQSNSTGCVALNNQDSRSVYFSIDGLPARTDCLLRLYTTKQCQGSADTVLQLAKADWCQASGNMGTKWSSVTFACRSDTRSG